ncbi:hypothetical protein [Parafrankia sp. FMc2]|uniref:hypothetical protein n=1 Tax=Parafrankia sp. FMc2 TaxID=3233196 RepID=UPI0034D79BA7
MPSTRRTIWLLPPFVAFEVEADEKGWKALRSYATAITWLVVVEVGLIVVGHVALQFPASRAPAVAMALGVVAFNVLGAAIALTRPWVSGDH